eukprot:218522-Chlamydomonas_euryale.AAC.7
MSNTIKLLNVILQQKDVGEKVPRLYLTMGHAARRLHDSMGTAAVVDYTHGGMNALQRYVPVVEPQNVASQMPQRHHFRQAFA